MICSACGKEVAEGFDLSFDLSPAAWEPKRSRGLYGRCCVADAFRDLVNMRDARAFIGRLVRPDQPSPTTLGLLLGLLRFGS